MGGNEVEEKILRIVELAVEINKKTEYAASIDIHGHVSFMTLNVMKSKEEYQTKIIDHTHLFFNEVDRFDKAIATLEGLLDGSIVPIYEGEEIVIEWTKPKFRKLVI